MSSEMPEVVRAYIEQVESDTPRSGKDQKALAALIRKTYQEEDLNTDEEQLAHYLSLAKYWPFELFPWEKFLIALWLCTYTADGMPRWPELFAMIARGAGKDGAIAYCTMCLTSPYNPVAQYNVDICANNEDQAMTPVKDLIEVLENPKHQQKLNKHFYHTKELVQGRKNRGIIRGRTNNPKGRDGLRTSVAIFNEVHAYENYENIEVFTTGLGKRAQPRIGIFTSNGKVSDGPLDDYIAQSERILYEGEADKGFLPFLCRLETKEQVHDPQNWFMANPSLQYLPDLYKETEREYEAWLKNPERHGSLLTKRMNLRVGFTDVSVTDYEKVRATNAPLPDLAGWSCTVGLDYAEISDWASVLLHFKRGEQRFDICHTWICAKSKTLPLVHAPWQAWVEKGFCTLVDEETISPDLLAAYIQNAGAKYNLRRLAMDHYRWTLVASAMKKVGFDADDKTRVKLVRPSDIMQVEPVIQRCFDSGLFVWGDYPPLRWAVQNTKRVRASKKAGSDTGNFYYAKIEAKSRKTDPFMALVAAMTVEADLDAAQPVALPPIGVISI